MSRIVLILVLCHSLDSDLIHPHRPRPILDDRIKVRSSTNGLIAERKLLNDAMASDSIDSRPSLSVRVMNVSSLSGKSSQTENGNDVVQVL